MTTQLSNERLREMYCGVSFCDDDMCRMSRELLAARATLKEFQRPPCTDEQGSWHNPDDLALIERLQRPGWRWVPVEPTVEMLRAGKAVVGNSARLLDPIYRAMLSAAPLAVDTGDGE